MRINPDCVRIVILTIENNLGVDEYWQLDDLMKYPLVQSFSKADIEYSLRQLTAENMIECDITRYIRNSFSYIISDVTPEGHKLCDSFRNDNLWVKIKPYVKDVSTVSGLLSSVAVAVSKLVQQ